MSEGFVYGIMLITNIYGYVTETLLTRFRTRFRKIARLQLGGSGAVDSRPLLRRKEYRSVFRRPNVLRNSGFESEIRFYDLDLSMLRYRA